MDSKSLRFYAKAAKSLLPHQIKIELLLLLIVTMGFILLNSGNLAGGILISVALLGLSILYFIMSFRGMESRDKVEIVGVLLKTRHYPGSDIMINAGMLSLVVALLGTVIFKLRQKQLKFDMQVLRSLVILAVLVYFFQFTNLVFINETEVLNH